MSFDIYYLSLRHGEPLRFPLLRLEQLFGPYIEARAPSDWDLRFPDGGYSHVFVHEEETEQIFNLAIERPAAAPELWEALYTLMRERPSMLYWPGGSAVADHAYLTELGDGIATGSCAVVGSAAELLNWVGTTA